MSMPVNLAAEVKLTVAGEATATEAKANATIAQNLIVLFGS